MRILYQIKAVSIAFLLMIFILFPACLIAIPFSLTRRLKIVCPAWGVFANGVLRYACSAKIGVKEDHRSPEFRGVPAYGIYIANHQSFLDIPLIMLIYQLPPIMKKEILYIPIFGWLTWVSGALAVSRSSADSRKKIFSAARKRVRDERVGVQVYPEGTRSKDGLPRQYESIKRTLMVFAYNEKIPVIPTSLYGTRGILNKKGMITPNRHIGIIVHKEIDPAHFDNVDDFCKATWAKVLEGHEQIKTQLQPLNGNLSLA